MGLTAMAGLAWVLAQQVSLWSGQGLGAASVEAAAEGFAADRGQPVPVVVELFTSEGCSSCPPADRLLSELAEQPIEGVRIIPLSLHVDYWNRLGWKDPYSDAQYSKRQRTYGELMRLRSVYTPQMVVDGRREFVGSNRGKALREIKAAASQSRPLMEVEVLDQPGENRIRLALRLDKLPDKYRAPLELMLAVTEYGLGMQVTAGENRGRRLAHDAVVRQLGSAVRLPQDAEDPFDYRATVRLKPEWKRDNLQVVAFLQDAQGAIHAAGTASLR
ncbi:MAG TPA: DUF1223 domain-containing protein [Acidobacteriota bacterium]|nr:DUF1223 domain-containing protein [Acidobacteriota bacterium]